MTTATAMTYAWAEITKVEDREDGTVMVYGPVADSGLDRDKQRLNRQWLDQAMPAWMAEGGNIREQHDPTRAVGVGVGLTKGDVDDVHLLAAHVIDDQAVRKVKAKVLKGFSVGIKEPRVQMGKADAPNGEVVGGRIIEVSLVDRPSNPRTLFTLAKADGAELAAVDGAELLERTDIDCDVPEAHLGQPGGEILKFVSAAQRKKDAAAGVAMPNGDFPIPDEGHLRSAIGHLGNYTGDKAAARRHIIARARALGLTKLLPEGWNVSKADQILADVAQWAPIEPASWYATKADTADIASAVEAIAAIARLIQSDAAGMAAGDLTEDREISYLLDAVRALKYFVMCEQEEEEPDDGTGSGGGGQAADDFNMAGDVILMADDKPDVTKTDKPDTTKTDATKVDGGSPLTKTEFATMLKTAVAEATEPLKDDLGVVKAELAKALAAPAPGGPVQTRTAAQTGAPANDHRSRANALLVKAANIGNADPALAQGYRDQANALLAKADA